MIKFTADLGGGKTLIGLGLSEINLERLKQDKPILVDGNQIGMPNIQVLILYGKTEKDIRDSLKEFIGKDTKEFIDLKAMKDS